MTDRDAQASFARTFVDELARAGVRDAFVSPGSRNTPLSLAFVAEDRIRVHVVLDERSAAFAALGVGRASGRPAVLCCTSGTAAANYHPAVVEAHHGAIPLVVCTADRPARLRDTGANQTIDQTALYGRVLRSFADATVYDDARVIASRAVHAALGAPAGPVQCNLQFDEPLVPTGAVEIAPPRDEPGGMTAPEPTLVELPPAERPVVVAGWGADATPPPGVPLLADPLSGLRDGADAISTYEALLRVDSFASAHEPDLVVRVGMPPTGKALHRWFGGRASQLLVMPDDRPADPFASGPRRIDVPRAVLQCTAAPDAEWVRAWRAADSAARAAIDAALDSFATPFEGRVVRDIAAWVPSGGTLYVGSSMPVRDLEYFMAPRGGLRVVANRGASGIDGNIATFAGLGVGGAAPLVGVIGDLAFLHDTNGLLAWRDADSGGALVVLDNDGGGIFEFLPQRTAVPDRFEELFGTPHGLDLVAVARAHGVAAERVTDTAAVLPAVARAVAAATPTVVVIPSDRSENRERHRAVWDAVAATLV